MKALIVAAHGDGDGSLANREIESLAEHAARLLGVDEWTAAFHRGTPGFATAVDRLESQEVVVVPLMTANGYYCKQILPRELKKAQSYSARRVHITEPVGTSPLFFELAVKRVTQLREVLGPVPSEAALMVIGHGTERNPQSRVSTEDLTKLLRDRFEFKAISAAFMDEDPSPGKVADAWRKEGVERGIVLPFLIASGNHSQVDIPNSLKDFPGQLIIDRALGSWPDVGEIIASRAQEQRPLALGGAS